ncbi:c-type cytochrome [Hymenobacter caeli]|uniref:Mono/diheme cytochrome c family protein n=1 Tax=Hymenobacter caeli TaxID=2735894 RepID=A0ABX2FTL0_9BACT|nr:cytochrome c [Hymenobacter caeli]NRT20302.1 mono/diheme cytochrome c family protein [Hymenobacter caeli]
MIRRFLPASLLLAVALALPGTGPAGAQTKPKPKAAAAGAPAPALLAQGKKVYTQYCLTCHQADGGGVQNMNPPLIKTTYVLGDKARLANILVHGFSEQVAINGETYNNIMPAHDFLTDAQMAAVLTYVRNSFGNKASAVSVAEVKAARAAGKK